MVVKGMKYRLLTLIGFRTTVEIEINRLASEGWDVVSVARQDNSYLVTLRNANS